MVVWRIEGDEIGPNGAGASFYATKLEAERALREFRDFNIKILRRRRGNTAMKARVAISHRRSTLARGHFGSS